MSCKGPEEMHFLRMFFTDFTPALGRPLLLGLYVKCRPCGDAHGTGSRLGKGERSTKTYFPNALGVVWCRELMANDMFVAELNKVSTKLGTTVAAN